jgi:uncharacterized radical SAM superfamily Fe-S cluster-containing enzyme
LPICLNRISAKRITAGERVDLVKVCPDHGFFWNGRLSLDEWRRSKVPAILCAVPDETQQGCPFDCGLCREHRQRSCTVLLEVTRRCNLYCPVCFAGSQADAATDPSLQELRSWYQKTMRLDPGSNVQLSGGEPTVRDDLPEMVAAGREAGFEFIQLNTNGIRLTNDRGYIKGLKKAELASVFFAIQRYRRCGASEAARPSTDGHQTSGDRRLRGPRHRGCAGSHTGFWSQHAFHRRHFSTVGGLGQRPARVRHFKSRKI